MENVMGYQIEAYLESGKPALKIYDIDKKDLCLSWCYQGKCEDPESHTEIQRLFRELLLLTCKQDLHNVRVFNLSMDRKLTPRLDS